MNKKVKEPKIERISDYTPTRGTNKGQKVVVFGCGAVKVTQQTLEETISYL